MEQRKDSLQIKVGIFVGVSLVFLVVVLFLLGSERRLFDSQYTLGAHFKDISGLRAGAPAQMAGINLGTVDKIIFSSSLINKVK
jgi:phospholipid/cholesterol/gamma-HCH transport system substrate-binding protein